ncbi:MAG: sn-glycerol-1-phosphate dehydrogenase [Clostridia bacterium]|nr:sn-glycerol-1-phosphate dehydrogenase [Clostridia bacterium]
MDINLLCGSIKCPKCGRVHNGLLKFAHIRSGAIDSIPGMIRECFNARRVFLLADKNTYRVAGESVASVLGEGGIEYSEFIFNEERLAPDEEAVGAAVLHYDYSAEVVIGVGSGVINDIGKVLSRIAGVPYIIVATAPSMDGYASALSSMERDGLKVSIPAKCPDAVIGDTDILRDAPEQMLRAGLGDMIAKYISICEWRIASLICGEYYCEYIADIIRNALRECVDNADGLMARDEAAVRAVFEGLLIGGIAMNFAGLSRPASGGEHYISHIWDMRGLEFGTPVDLHGIQCAIGTVIELKKYEELVRISAPSREEAMEYVRSFDYEAWCRKLRGFLGRAADTMIELEKREGKYAPDLHAKRLDTVLENWSAIRAIITEELPRASEVERMLGLIGAPRYASDIDIPEELVPITLCATRDIRDKYVLSRLVWDLGLTDRLFGEV